MGVPATGADACQGGEGQVEGGGPGPAFSVERRRVRATRVFSVEGRRPAVRDDDRPVLEGTVGRRSDEREGGPGMGGARARGPHEDRSFCDAL